MNINSSANNYFRTAAHIGVQQKAGVRHVLGLPGGILLWKSVAKVVLWGLPVVLAMNLLLSTLIHSQAVRIDELKNSLAAVEAANITLRSEKAQLTSPDRVKVAAAEKLALYEPAPGQIQRM